MEAALGVRIRELRKDRGLSQVELADKLGVEQSTVSRWERNLVDPELKHIKPLASALGS